MNAMKGTSQKTNKALVFSLFGFLAALSLALPFAEQKAWFDSWYWLGPILLASSSLLALPLVPTKLAEAGLIAAVLLTGCLALLVANQSVEIGKLKGGFWLLVVSLLGFFWLSLSQLSARSAKPLAHKAWLLLIPMLFGAGLLFIWEVVVQGFRVPHVLLPSPSVIGKAFVASMGTLAADFYQTFVRAVIPGYLIGNCCGFAVALLADRVPFLQRGLLPLGNFVSAIPIVGIAPIMVMWFGFDWQSKAAVVVIMTFFPMLVNTIVGLSESSKMEQDLMRSYGASYWQTLTNLRLPNALPFIFNALKINSTLALIGAIVAEFFGTPIVGMGFRISTEVGRMNIDMVWATIVVAAVAGSLFYGFFALLERGFTFWHPSFRKSR